MSSRTVRNQVFCAWGIAVSAWGVVGCGEDAPGAATTPAGEGGATGGAAGAGGGAAAVPCEGVGACTFELPAVWQEPVADYVAAASASGALDMGTLQKSINDLMVYGDRMYFGYGDATLNAGTVVPIELRFWDDPAAPAPSAEPVVTTEEVISLYRRFDDLLVVPGVDAIEDNFLGNILVKSGGEPFVRHRSIYGGVHVHDTALFQGALYTCGSGTIDLETWNLGKVHSWLWRSTDLGESWEALYEVENEVVGDRRWIQMAPFADELLLYGYRTNGAGTLIELIHSRFDGETLVPLTSPTEHFVLQAEKLTPDLAILSGVYVVGGTRYEALSSAGSASASPIAALAGKSLLDFFVVEDGLGIALIAEGDTYPPPASPAPWSILSTRDGVTFEPLVSTQTAAAPTAVAYWRGDLYVGMADGQVLRAAGSAVP